MSQSLYVQWVKMRGDICWYYLKCALDKTEWKTKNRQSRDTNRLYCWICQMIHETSFQLLTCILSTVKTGIQSYCNISYSRGGVNQMWILKNSKYLLEYIQSRSLSSCNSIRTFDFSTLYTTIPHSKLKNKLRELVQLCFIKKNGQRRYKYLVLGRDHINGKFTMGKFKSSLLS
jgi:hypothetical protein